MGAGMIRILMSGLSNDRVELAVVKGLSRAGVRLHAIADPGSAFVAEARAMDMPCVEYRFQHRFDRAAVKLYRRLTAEHSFDVLHCLSNRSLSTALLATRNMARPPVIVAYRGTMGHLSWFDPASHYSYLHRRVDSIICVSGAVRDYLRGFRIPERRLEVIWKGHDPCWYQAAPRSALHELGIPDNAVVVNFTGNIRPVKGADVLLRAFAHIRPEENIHLVLVGEVRDKNVKRLLERAPLYVHAIGFREDAIGLAGACDIAAMPSVEREGLPKSVLEAMAQGVPAVVSDVGGMPEVVEDGVSGIVVPPKNAEALAAAIRRLAGHAELRQQMGRAARTRIEGPFHIRHTVEKTLSLYQRLIATP